MAVVYPQPPAWWHAHYAPDWRVDDRLDRILPVGPRIMPIGNPTPSFGVSHFSV